MSHGPPTIGGIGLDLSDDIICRATQAGISQRHMKTIPIIRDRTRNRLLTLRLLSIAAMLSLIILVPALLAIPLPATPLLVVIGILALASLFGIAPNRRALPITSLETWIHLSIDLAGWSAFLYYSGGATNPAISILLPPVAIGAAMLPATHAWALAGTAIGAYTLLWEYHRPLDVYDSALAINWHLAGMWLTFSISAALITFYIVRMTAAIRSRDLALAQARERALRDERILALGSLAAGAAHELGTPLGTLAVLIGEQLRPPEHSAQAREDLDMMRTQVKNCKNILTRLTQQAGLPRAAESPSEDIGSWLRKLCSRWQVLRPEASVRLALTEELAEIEATFDANVEHALLNIINNAADASSAPVRVEARLPTPSTLEISVIDEGSGFDGTIGASSENPKRGLGIGLVLSRASIERANGHLDFSFATSRGTVATITLPVESPHA